jgi:hypothetical protein
MATLLYVILGLVIFGIVVTLYVDYQAHKRSLIFAEHIDDLIARVKRIEEKDSNAEFD